MGNLLRLLSRDGDSCFTLPKHDIFVDFESAQPTVDEVQLYQEAEDVLRKSEEIIRDLQNYKGASKEIREAITKPSLETEFKAWEAIYPLVMKLKTFYDFSIEMEAVVPKILRELCVKHTPGVGTAVEQLDEHQALVKQFAKLLEFVLKFDEYKMMNPALQNDFSYFRRTTQRMRNLPPNRMSAPPSTTMPHEEVIKATKAIHASYEQIDMAVPVGVANTMSLFFAHATPMLQSMSAAVTQFVEDNADNPSVSNTTTDMLSVMAKVCQKMLDTPELRSRLQYEETELFILRVMVAIIILYDHVHPTGAFAKGTQVDVKGCVRVVRDQEGTRAESLLNTLRYTTKHLNEESTPKSTKTLLFDTKT